ncbi:BnaC08g49340D [Brassica napus]|uniref:BnaC02g40100D protein n=2 Tax=Brassica napus TaxID=3708 RepID=A0A078GK67_BRANA|nr:BnaC02g40100D [Brassica napus]CDY59760.1 BnaC08g49340D [Brassica napus]
MVVTGTLDDDGLGPVSWWEGSTSNENHEDDDDT